MPPENDVPLLGHTDRLGETIPRHDKREIVEEVAKVWNQDNAANGVVRRWEVYNDGHAEYPWTLRLTPDA